MKHTTRNIRKLLLSALVLVSINSDASCLKEVANYAQAICSEINRSGFHALTDEQGKLTVQVSGVVQKVVGPGGTAVTGRELQLFYKSILREELAKEDFEVRHCRKTMTQKAMMEVCAKQSTVQRRGAALPPYQSAQSSQQNMAQGDIFGNEDKQARHN